MNISSDSDWTREVPSDHSVGVKYIVKFKQGVYSCTCLAWKIQRSPITQRTCKHLIRLRGAEVEKRRAPESFYGLTRAKRTDPKPTPVAFMSFYTWNPLNVLPHKLEGWLYSIKLDGVFARWSDGKLVTKSGRELHPPRRITETLPREIDLDGEVYHPDRQKVRKAALADEWGEDVEFVAFDLFDTTLTFEQRWQRLEHYHQRYPFKVVKQYTFVASEWPKLEAQIRHQAEEGLVLRDRQGLYEAGKRSRTTLKWKPLSEGQARIEELQPKKIGVRLMLREMSHDQRFSEHTFNVYSRRAPEQFHKDEMVRFIYTGRDENGRPELAQLKTHGVLAEN